MVIDGLATDNLEEVRVTSDTVTSDYFVDESDEGPYFLSRYPAVIYSADDDEMLTAAQRTLIREQLGINAVHNQEAPRVQAQTRPAAGAGDRQNQRGPAPGWTRVIDQQKPFDLILFLSKDYDVQERDAQAYVNAHRSKLVKVNSEQAMLDAINARHGELNRDPLRPRKLRVLFVSHGNGEEGPGVGGGQAGDHQWDDLFNSPHASLANYDDPQVLAQYMQNVFPQTKLAQTAEKIEELVFSACQIAESPGARKLLDAIRQKLGAAKLVAGKKQLGPVWRTVGRVWVTEIHARNEDETPVKGDAPEGDVLHVSGGP